MSTESDQMVKIQSLKNVEENEQKKLSAIEGELQA
jgi:hypothetical protein